VDADAFFVSVEQALNPSLKGLPVIVGGTDRGVVSAASYEARKFGVRSATPIAQARRLCPDAIFLKPNFKAYKEYSSSIFEIIGKYSPIVEQTSVDEGYVDLGGSLRLHGGAPWEVAHRILTEIRESLEINCSGGLSSTKTYAKMATNLAKPNGLIYLTHEQAFKVLGNLPVGAIPGVGEKAEAKLRRNGIYTVRDLTLADPLFLSGLLGAWGEKLADKAAGRGSHILRVKSLDGQKSYSKERTLDKDATDHEMVKRIARTLLEGLGARLRVHEKAASTVTFKIRRKDFSEVSKSMTMKQPANSNSDLLNCLETLFKKTLGDGSAIRRVGVSLSGISKPLVQLNLFEPQRVRNMARDAITDQIRGKFGFNTVLVRGEDSKTPKEAQ
jgi:DNA polymerase-4